MQNIVKFENQEIELITVDSVPMMTLSQIVTALGAASNQASQLYSRHSDEFTPEMTRIIKQGRTRIRVFNREGAWLIGMFARTPKAAAFRKWVLTALAEHIDGTPTRSFPICPDDLSAIVGTVKRCVAKAVRDELDAYFADTIRLQNDIKNSEAYLNGLLEGAFGNSRSMNKIREIAKCAMPRRS